MNDPKLKILLPVTWTSVLVSADLVKQGQEVRAILLYVWQEGLPTSGNAEFKVRFQISSDSFRSQCFARAEVWSPTELKWNSVHFIPYAAMKTPEGLAYYPSNSGVDWKHFRKDLETLINVTMEVLL